MLQWGSFDLVKAGLNQFSLCDSRFRLYAGSPEEPVLLLSGTRHHEEACTAGSKMGHKEDTSPLVLHSALYSFLAANCDCDCACAVDLPLRLEAKPASGVWVRQAHAFPIPIEGQWRAFYNPAGPIGLSALNMVAQQVLAAFDVPLSLAGAFRCLPEMTPVQVEEAVDNLVQVGLLQPVGTPLQPPASPSALSGWLHITQACNLDCPYCYVQKRPGAMSTEVGRKAVDKLVEMAVRHGYRSLKLKYAGGEPTLHFPLIQAIHAHAARQTAEAGLDLEEAILSNGVGVTDIMLDAIAQAGMRLMVSLDGGPSTHDQVRAMRDGRGTYALVVDTVERAIARGLRPNVSITLTALSLDGVKEAVAFALERALPFNLNFYRECASGCQQGRDMPSLLMPDPIRLVEVMLGIFDVIRLYPTYPLSLAGILDRARLDFSNSYPCAAGRDYLVVDTQGSVSACQMLLSEPWSDLDEFDPLEAVRQRGERVFTPVDEHLDCRECLWRLACGGGCPLMRNTPAHDDYCLVYRALFPELIRLEARRLIAIQSSRPSFSL
jgi:uncharacterized protein